MNKYVKRSLLIAGFAGGFWVAGTGIASADEAPPDDESSAVVSVDLPATLSGTAVSGTGESTQDPATPEPEPDPIVSVDVDAVTGAVASTGA